MAKSSGETSIFQKLWIQTLKEELTQPVLIKYLRVEHIKSITHGQSHILICLVCVKQQVS